MNLDCLKIGINLSSTNFVWIWTHQTWYKSEILQTWFEYEVFQLDMKLGSLNVIWTWAIQTYYWYFSYRCIVNINVVWLFLMVPWVDMQCMVFPGHTHLPLGIIKSSFKLDINLSHSSLIWILAASNCVWIWALPTWYVSWVLSTWYEFGLLQTWYKSYLLQTWY